LLIPYGESKIVHKLVLLQYSIAYSETASQRGEFPIEDQLISYISFCLL